MEKILILIMQHEDGDSYRIGKDLDKMKQEFDEAVNTGFFRNIVLALVGEDCDFGFGAYGDFFGGEVLEECNLVKDF